MTPFDKARKIVANPNGYTAASVEVASALLAYEPTQSARDAARTLLEELYRLWDVDITYIDDPFQGRDHLAAIEAAITAAVAASEARARQFEELAHDLAHELESGVVVEQRDLETGAETGFFCTLCGELANERDEIKHTCCLSRIRPIGTTQEAGAR